MAVLRITAFGGIIPRLGKRLLPDNNAQYALNAQLFSGELRSWQKPRLLQRFSTTYQVQDVYHYRRRQDMVDHYIPFPRRTDVVRAPIINDAYGRLYWTDGVAMYTTTMDDVEAGVAPIKTGVAMPTFNAPITVTATGGTAKLQETRVYTAIYVSKYGEEGPANSAYTVTTTGNADGTWTIAGLNGYNNATPNITKLRLYRTITSPQTGVAYRMVKEWPIGSVPASYVEDVPATTVAVNPVLQSLSWTPPPDGLQGLCAGPGGMLSAFKGNTVYFSVPFYPHAWPNEQQLAVPDDIVSIAWTGSLLVIGTTGHPAYITGTSPTALSLQNFGDVIPCVSRDSMVAAGGSVFFASLDGLMAVSQGSGLTNVTNTFCTRDDWQKNFNPTTLSGAIYQARYFGFYSSQLGLSLGFDDATTGLTDLQYDGVKRIKNSAVDNSAHIIVGNSVLQWDAATLDPLLYVWRSKPFLTPKPVNFGVLQVRGDFVGTGGEQPPAPPPIQSSGFAVNDAMIDEGTINGIGVIDQNLSTDTVGVKLYGDGKLRWVGTISSEAPVRLPSGFKCSQWEVELSGNISVFSVVLAGTAKELESVP